MVRNVTSLTGSGLRDWFIQQVSAVVLGSYFTFLLIYFLFNSPMEYSQWQLLFSSVLMKLVSFVALLSLIFHAWIGIWTVFTDYIKPYSLRMTLQVLLILALLSYLYWGILIFWSV